MAGVAPPKTVGVPTSTTQHLQGLLVRKTATAEPKSLAQYFNHVADAVRVNDEVTAMRTANLKRRWQVAAHGYEAVLNRKKRSAVVVSRQSVTGPAYLTRAAPVAVAAATPPSVATASAAPAAAAPAAATLTTANANQQNEKTHPNPAAVAAAAAAAAAVSARAAAAPKPVARPVAVAAAPAKPALLVQAATPKPTPIPVQSLGVRPPPTTMAAPSTAATVPAQNPLIPASMAPVKPTQLHVSLAATQQPIPMPVSLAQTTQPLPHQPLQPQPLQPQPVATAPTVPRRSDFVVGSRVMIRHTADLVACGARNLVGKTGRIVAVPQVYGQEVYSVYIDEHETMFQVPFNALVLISPPAPTPMPINMQHQPPPRSMHQLAPGGMISQAQPQGQPQASMVGNVLQATATSVPAAGVHGVRPTPSIEDIKLEHSYQLHRLMQQQYREIQVLQQQYAECRLVNPAALPSIQKELSKLRLVHLSQVQTLKSKQALDLLGK